MMSRMTGEKPQDIGMDGLQRARTWLNLSTRVNRSWTCLDSQLTEMLQFQWPYDSNGGFSFDLGGRFQGDQLEGQSFLAEVKNYKRESKLAYHFRDFLAKCYVALGDKPYLCDNFLWISWSPFQAKAWDKHATAENVGRCVLDSVNRKRVLGVENPDDAKLKLVPERIAQVASRVWLVTLSEQQERLVVTESHYHLMRRVISEERGVGE